VAIFLASSTTTTLSRLGTIIERLIETLIGAFTLGRALGYFSTVRVAFFTLVSILFYYSFSAFFASATRALASLSTAACALFLAISFTFLSLFILFLRVFVAH
jgi:hypothetical protein